MTLRNIQISRGVAALIVLLAHANLMVGKTLFDGALIIGWCGVDFFFVLSGFIIYMTSSRYVGVSGQLRPYLLRRIKRVFPIYWIYTVLVLFLAGFVFAVTGVNLISYADLSIVGLIQTTLLLPSDVPAGVMPVLPVAWTLSYELLFYALFGIALLVKPKVSLGLALAWVVAISAGANGFFEGASHTSLLWVLIQTRNLEFLMGCLSAWAVCSNRIHVGLGRPMLCVGLLMLTASWVNAHFQFRWAPQTEFLVFGVPFFFIVTGSALLDLKGNTAHRLLSRVAVFLGDASYSIYLVHYTVILVICTVGMSLHLPAITTFSIAVVMSVSAGIIAFTLIERPLMKHLNKPANSKIKNQPYIYF